MFSRFSYARCRRKLYSVNNLVKTVKGSGKRERNVLSSEINMTLGLIMGLKCTQIYVLEHTVFISSSRAVCQIILFAPGRKNCGAITKKGKTPFLLSSSLNHAISLFFLQLNKSSSGFKRDSTPGGRRYSIYCDQRSLSAQGPETC